MSDYKQHGSFSKNPYQPPKSRVVDTNNWPLFQRGKYVVLQPGATWPDRCIKCNAPASYKKNLTMAYVNPWIYLSILVSILITVILALIFQKKFKISLPLCELHRRRRLQWMVINWLLFALAIGLIILGIANHFEWLTGIGFLVLLVLMITLLATRLGYIAKYRDQRIWIRGTGNKFRESLPELD